MQKFLVTLLRFYQRSISPYLKSQCKFHPSCSEYAILAIRKYGSLKGAVKTVFRLIKCNPFSKEKIDFP